MSMENPDMGRMQERQSELVELIGKNIEKDGIFDPMPGLRLFRASAPVEMGCAITKPALGIIAQGSKQVSLGDERYVYGPGRYLLASVELPVVSQIIEASKSKPYLSLALDLDPSLVGSVMVEAGISPVRDQGQVKAMDVSPLNADLVDAAVRLLRLLDSPADARMLVPLVVREIIYRLLVGNQGARLGLIALNGGQAHRIVKVVSRLRTDFDKPLRIEAIAREIGMSPSGLHHHFKAVTAMSPLQFQKQLRLHEARRLMLDESLDAASAGYRVGYDDASHFNREYKKFFGEPPMRDVEKLRDMPRAVAGV